jgi:MFS transporter, NNP family, nitrate/nitrite transporter
MDLNTKKSFTVLFLCTLAFTLAFATWTMNGVLFTFLTEKGIYDFSGVQIGWLLGTPILMGSIMRFPLGILTDKFGGKFIYAGLLLFSAIPLYLLTTATTYNGFIFYSFLFGSVGASFAVGVAFTSLWFNKSWQGRALGIFGMGNAGAAVTTFLAPSILNHFHEIDPINGWKNLPKIYALCLVIVAVLLLVFTTNRKTQNKQSFSQIIAPIKSIRMWRFGLYYLVVFGFFVAYSQWLVPNFINVYDVSLVTAGLYASFFSLPSGIIRAFGGYLSDKFGARTVMYWVLITSVIFSFMLIIPKMEIYTKGPGVMALKSGEVVSISSTEIVVKNELHKVKPQNNQIKAESKGDNIFPVKESWQEIVVKENQTVKKKEILAKGITKITFDANRWVYLSLIILIGISWGIGKAAVYKHIPDYFPNNIGAVGGMVGLIGGLGGFFGPIIFGYLLATTGIWSSSWILICLVSLICLLWMHFVITKMMNEKATSIKNDMDYKN